MRYYITYIKENISAKSENKSSMGIGLETISKTELPIPETEIKKNTANVVAAHLIEDENADNPQAIKELSFSEISDLAYTKTYICIIFW